MGTSDEQATLALYAGWGGLPQVFGSDKPNWLECRERLQVVLTDSEYDAARSSTLNAHYTSPIVIQGIYDAIGRMGFRGGRVLEPACGTGLFLGAMPEEMAARSRITGIELDSISAGIAKALYPDSKIQHSAFEDTKLANETFDLAISNVPFGNYQPYDPQFDRFKFSIHDYFFAASAAKVRPGGLLAFITSRYTLDKVDPKLRKHLAMENTEFLGAIRLPDNAFTAMANTRVTTDIVFLKKLAEGEQPRQKNWIGLAPHPL